MKELPEGFCVNMMVWISCFVPYLHCKHFNSINPWQWQCSLVQQYFDSKLSWQSQFMAMPVHWTGRLTSNKYSPWQDDLLLMTVFLLPLVLNKYSFSQWFLYLFQEKMVKTTRNLDKVYQISTIWYILDELTNQKKKQFTLPLVMRPDCPQ